METQKYYDSYCCFRSSENGSKRVLWELTQRCNLNCPHCHVQAKNEKQQELTKEEAFRVLQDLKRNGINEIIFSGGEPFVYPYLLDLIHEAHRLDFSIDLCTNGTVHNKEQLKLLSTYLSEISITLDGSNPSDHESNKGQSGFFKKTVETIRYLSDLGMEVHIIAVVQQSNMDHILDIPAFVRDLGAHSITFLGRMDTRVFKEPPISQEKLRELSRQLEVIRAKNTFIINTKRLFLLGPLGKCMAGENLFGIDSGGHFLKCILLPDSSPENDLRTHSIQDIIQSWSIDDISSPDNCSYCEHRQTCGKGCPGSSWLKYDKPGSDQNCWNLVYPA